MTCLNCGKEIKPEESAYLGERGDHLWDEWKHRHDSWSRTFTRWLWTVGVLALLPFTNIPWLRREFYVSIYDARCLYGFLLFALFAATNWQLAIEYAAFKSLEPRLIGLGVSHDLWWCKLKRVFRGRTLFYTGVYLIICGLVLGWVYYHYPPP